MSTKYGIGIHIEETTASASVIRNNNVEQICQCDGGTVFAHDHALKNYDACEVLFKRIKDRAQILLGSIVDSAVVSFSYGVGPNPNGLITISIVKRAAQAIGFQNVWISPKTTAGAIYIYKSMLDPDESLNFLQLSKDKENYVLSAFEMSDGILESYGIGCYPYMSNDTIDRFLENLGLTVDNDYNKIYVSYDTKLNLDTWNRKEDIIYIKNDYSYGDAVLACKRNGDIGFSEFMVLEIFSAFIGIKDRLDHYIQLVEKDVTIPVKRVVLLPVDTLDDTLNIYGENEWHKPVIDRKIDISTWRRSVSERAKVKITAIIEPDLTISIQLEAEGKCLSILLV